ncbi:hypothetical protein DBV15_01795 [Temnothorax longispinosus]|uniref:Uncharacterized protein n=1 Tax=Temnothorax longispinosus TaxID=300112 RepID=A0A4S2KM95_9HYME|nr:hypothetical protein DBV15_01795 [Temnothorax longispinosus]
MRRCHPNGQQPLCGRDAQGADETDFRGTFLRIVPPTGPAAPFRHATVGIRIRKRGRKRGWATADISTLKSRIHVAPLKLCAREQPTAARSARSYDVTRLKYKTA